MNSSAWTGFERSKGISQIKGLSIIVNSIVNSIFRKTPGRILARLGSEWPKGVSQSKGLSIVILMYHTKGSSGYSIMIPVKSTFYEFIGTHGQKTI